MDRKRNFRESVTSKIPRYCALELILFHTDSPGPAGAVGTDRGGLACKCEVEVALLTGLIFKLSII